MMQWSVSVFIRSLCTNMYVCSFAGDINAAVDSGAGADDVQFLMSNNHQFTPSPLLQRPESPHCDELLPLSPQSATMSPDCGMFTAWTSVHILYMLQWQI